MAKRPLLVSGKMVCPHCGGPLDFIKDSRPEILFGFKVVERRRQCSECKKRSTTVEMTEADMVSMSKHFEVARQERIADLKAQIEALQ